MSINNLSFNSTVSNLACATDQGFIVYGLDPNLEKQKTFEMGGGVGIVRMLGRTNMALLVGGGTTPFKSKDTFVLWDGSKNEGILEIDMKEPVKNVHINKTHFIIVLEKKIVLFNWRGLHIESKITYSNDKGLCIMNGNLDVIATLGTNKGEIAIWKYSNDIYKTIKAHTTNIEAIALNHDGTYVATASETGTLIRVFNVETELQEYEFRRGSQSAYVYDICFSQDTKILACCSGNGTVHIWDLYNDPNVTKNTRSYLSVVNGYIPFTQYFGSQWGMKNMSLGNTNRAVCEFDKDNNLHISTYDGSYYKISYKGGEFSDLYNGNLHINNK